MINLINSILPVISMIIGFYFGFKIDKTKEIPEIKTIPKIIEEKKQEKEKEKKQNKMTKYLMNIENYPNNQIDIEE